MRELHARSFKYKNNHNRSHLIGATPEVVESAAARGLLPLSNGELLESVVTLSSDSSDLVRQAATATPDTLDPDTFTNLASQCSRFYSRWRFTSNSLLQDLSLNLRWAIHSRITKLKCFAAVRIANFQLIAVESPLACFERYHLVR